MKMICKNEALYKDGSKIMNFTKGVVYDFHKSYDPEGWETTDDIGETECFFNLNLMFESI